MLSISKVMALVAIVGAVWYGFKLIGRLDEARNRKADPARRNESARPAAGRPHSGGAPDGVVDLVQDETGAYVAKDKRDDRV